MADAIIAPAAASVRAVAQLAGTGGLLRFTTAGSVDDGKSTLIGRLLYDTQSAYEDQIDSVRKSRINRSSGSIDLSLLTDGLRAEREQGITIDVAYRYFSTPRRKFIIADTPGHEQYTRNMATGASTADVAIVLIDVTRGVREQSRRHAFIANLLGIRHLIFAVNKMDAVDYDQATFRRIAGQVRQLAEQLGVMDTYVAPVSALEGDNVVRRSQNMPWFGGPSLLEYLETVPLSENAGDEPFRLPVQYVIRPDATFRGFAGQVASGIVANGDPIVALPSGRRTRIRSIVSFDGERDSAIAGESITVTLEDEIDLSRGDLLVSAHALPSVSRHLRAHLVWMQAEPLDRSRLYLIKHTTRIARARVVDVLHRVDVNSLEFANADTLSLNDIASVELETTVPLLFDLYRRNRTMGSLILIDPISNATVAAGMIESGLASGTAPRGHGVRGHVSADDRRERLGHAPAAVWVDDEPLAIQLERLLFDEGWFVQHVPSPEFLPAELYAVASILRNAGAVAVFSGRKEQNPQKRDIADLFGAKAFFTGHSTEPILLALREWRAKYKADNTERDEQ